MTDAISARALRQAEFGRFGDVLAFDEPGSRPVNEGFARRSDIPAALDVVDGRPTAALYRIRPRPAPLRLVLFERHPFSPQAFVPMTAARFLVVVAESGDDGLPDHGGIRAFVGCAGQGVRYRPDVWHAPLMALDREADFLMLMAERPGSTDTIEHRLATPLLVML